VISVHPTPDVDRYLDRLGLDRTDVPGATMEALATLQRAHGRRVPFETLSVAGDPHGAYHGEPVSLFVPDLYEKVVERRRGGFCYELNGLFAWLLGALGFDVDRCAARVAAEEGYGPPADHLSLVVSLDRRCVVDVGVGAPLVRRPVPIDGGTVTDEVGVDWRVVPADRPDADHVLQYRRDEEAWTDRYIFDDTPRHLSYFEATCDYHANAPDSHFTGDPIAMSATDRGHVSLSPRTITRTVAGESEKREIDPDEYRALLAEEIGVRLSGE